MCAKSLPAQIPLNYNYHVASAIYRVLGTSSEQFASALHDDGYAYAGKRFKLFTFSQLRASRRTIANPHLVIRSNPVRLQVTSPKDDFCKHLIDGMLKNPEVSFGDQTLHVVEIREIDEPAFTASQDFICLSPITVSTHIDDPNRNSLHYCRLDGEFYTKVVENLKRKYTLLTDNPADDLHLDLHFNKRYMEERGGRISKLIDYKGTKIFGYMAPFTATGSPELMEIGYKCGFGDGNSKGLGMVGLDQSA